MDQQERHPRYWPRSHCQLRFCQLLAGLPGKGSYVISKHAFMGITKMAG
jgi:hypothetical protein